MATTGEYWQFAEEALQYAAAAGTEDKRKAFLEMARHWTLAAMRAGGMVFPDERQIPSPSTNPLLNADQKSGNWCNARKARRQFRQF